MEKLCNYVLQTNRYGSQRFPYSSCEYCENGKSKGPFKDQIGQDGYNGAAGVHANTIVGPGQTTKRC